ncbi:MAG: hypothetical protein JMN27_17110 [gamma proteobacterium endosymbiont of Lamellibrachia anaximandri]|nr:hypothetical protein [gamma proteobacterium endosymbiont of Lamellibrachia anaximandri]MBL3535526.1 hypothetical protein [gamma proteobacterium endosymbiont of Lamellibrachia anaximandri]
MASNLLHATFINFLAAVFLVPMANAGPAGAVNLIKAGAYETSKVCSNCHAHLFNQFEQSMHAKAFANPVFQNQLYDVLLPQVTGDPDATHRAGSCLACHSPTTFLTQGQHLPARNTLGESPPGVTCDFCHTTIGYLGLAPGNANYIPSPGPIKYGPLKFASDWHREYSPFQRKSEACAVCHEATNGQGVPMHTTYSEWKTSYWSRNGIECQHCHMSATGRLIAGSPVFESGTVAAGTLISPPAREQVFSHRFPGANAQSQLQGAVKLQVQSFPAEVKPGHTIFIGVELDNSEAGHSMPTGAIELRLAWLDVRLRMRGSEREWQLKAKPISPTRWDVAGMNPTDAALLGTAIADGSRLYRAIVVDTAGQQTLNNWEAVEKVFDNRLKAGEVRREMFRFTLPIDASGSLEAEVTLRYLRYPPGFVTRLGIAPADSVLMARASRIIEIAD